MFNTSNMFNYTTFVDYVQCACLYRPCFYNVYSINLNVIIYSVQFNNYINIEGRYGSFIFTLTIIDNYYSFVDFDNYTYNVLI